MRCKDREGNFIGADDGQDKVFGESCTAAGLAARW